MNSEQRFFRFLQERIGLDVASVGEPMVERALHQRCAAVSARDLTTIGCKCSSRAKSSRR